MVAINFDDDMLRTLCGHSYSKSNASLVKHFLSSWVALLYDSPLDARSHKPSKLLRKFLNGILRDGLLDTIKRYSGLADAVLKSQHLYGSIDLTNQWVEGFKDTPIFKEYHTFFMTGDPNLLRFILSFCLFGKKLKFKNKAWEEVAFRNWLGVEDRLSHLSLDDKVLTVVRQIVTHLIGATTYTDLYPKFGPGKVAEVGIRDEISKASGLRCHPYFDALAQRIGTAGASFPIQRFVVGSKGFYALTSRLKFVPKDITKARSICMEENTTMFLQQAVFEAYKASFVAGPMSRFVNLERQELNREAALYGSFTGDVDTLDLASASDSVSWELVKKIFPKEHLYYLALTRSGLVQVPDGRMVRVRKFAPMGSALCFPIQCVIFTSLAIYAAMCHSGWLERYQASTMRGIPTPDDVGVFIDTHFYREYGYINPHCKIYQPLRVYGDDIIVDSSLSTTLIRILTSCGFEVNEGKSFLASSAVRESCGGYYFRGFDVTPLRYTLGGQESAMDGRFAASSIALSNSAGDRGYFLLKKFSMQYILFGGGHKRPFLFSTDRDQTYAFYSMDPKNDHLRRCEYRDGSIIEPGSMSLKGPKGSFASAYQRDEVRCYTFAYAEKREANTDEVEAYDEYLYMRWWAKQRWSATDPFITGSLHRVTAGCRLKQAWKPA